MFTVLASNWLIFTVPASDWLSLSLQGGYNLASISDSMAMCTSLLLGDPPPSLVTPLPPPHHFAVATITSVIQHHAPYWRSLRINSKFGTWFWFWFWFRLTVFILVLQFQSRCVQLYSPQSIVGNVVLKAGSQTNQRCPLLENRSLR